MAEARLDPNDELHVLRNCWPIAVPKIVSDGSHGTLMLRACEDACKVKLNSKRGLLTRQSIADDDTVNGPFARHAMPPYSSMWNACNKPDPRLQVCVLGCAGGGIGVL